METAFKIHEPHHSHQSHDLLFSLGWNVLSVLFYDKAANRVNALFQYHIKRNTSSDKIAGKLKDLFEKEIAHWENIRSCRFYFNFKELATIPAEYYNEANNQAILRIMYAEDGEAEIFDYPIGQKNMHLIWRVRKDITDTIRHYFPSAQFRHSVACSLSNSATAANELQCIIYNNTFRVVFFKEGRLQLVRYFEYNAPEDVAYHLINVCRQHGVDVNDVSLQLSGLVDVSSNLYKELHKFFLDIHLGNTAAGILISDEIAKQPEQFFSHLTSLLLCE